MFITENYYKHGGDFDWKTFFSQSNGKPFIKGLDHERLFGNIRKHLKENVFQMTFSMAKVLREIFSGVKLGKQPKIIELGAGTGFLTRCLIEQYEGSGMLVDNNENSFQAFCKLKDHRSEPISYLVEDIFSLNILEKFDIVCSFGLIEHFENKEAVLSVHRKFVQSDGYILILVPLDSHLTRVFFDVHPELNLGYRELLSEDELISILRQVDFDVIKTKASCGYSYDFIAALCVL